MAYEIEGLGDGEWFSEAGQEEFWVTGTEEKGWAERRTDPRNPAIVKVRVDPGGRIATTSDLSIGGMLVNTDHPIAQGQPVTILVDSPHGALESRGLVRWMARGQGNDARASKLCMGVEFTWLSLGMGKLLK